jgi:hypothetical protein
VSGGRADGAVSGADSGRCADAPANVESRRAVAASAEHPLGVMTADPSTDGAGGDAPCCSRSTGGAARAISVSLPV